MLLMCDFTTRRVAVATKLMALIMRRVTVGYLRNFCTVAFLFSIYGHWYLWAEVGYRGSRGWTSVKTINCFPRFDPSLYECCVLPSSSRPVVVWAVESVCHHRNVSIMAPNHRCLLVRVSPWVWQLWIRSSLELHGWELDIWVSRCILSTMFELFFCFRFEWTALMVKVRQLGALVLFDIWTMLPSI